MEPSSEETATPAILFKPSKKRKIYRQRHDDESPLTQAPDHGPASTSHHHGDGPDNEAAHEPAVASAMRARNARRAMARRAGVGFSSDAPSDDTGALVLTAAQDEDHGAAVVKGIPDRFTYQTGRISRLDDRHMTEYIESRLSRRADPGNASSQPATSTTNPSDNPSGAARPIADQSTTHGKLVEVDVPLNDAWSRGDDTRKRKPGSSSSSQAQPPRRGRNRRNSDDVARDRLVEEFLHENRLDVYEVPQASTTAYTPATSDGRSADDRMAEEFRQRYLDEVAARRQKKKPAQPTRQQQQQAGDVLKGPKLGGSRNQRAAVRDILLKQEKEKSGRRY